ncbi:MAG: sel1 repeat family protein [Succinivibrio sp.]|nr:sel1 repeat family protein [Succinivibrio sp.]
MKKTTQNKTKLNSKSKYEGMALFDIEKDLLKVSEVKSSKLDLGLLDKEYKALASKKYTNFSKETSEFLYTAFLQNYLNHDDKAKCKIEDVIGNISFENLKPYLPKECKNFSDAYNYYIKKFDFLKLYKAVHNIVLPQEYDDSNADEISQDVPFEPNRFEDLCGFFSSIKRPCYVSCCFSALFARTYLVVTDEEYKHKRGYDADYTYKINCKVGDVVSTIEHFIDRTFNANTYQFGEDLLDEFSDLIVGGLHKNLTVYNKVAQREEMVSSSVIYGYPGDVAFKIGQAFYNGTDLPLDKFNARDWFAYGAAVGDIKCALAYMLHFMDVNFEDCGVANDNAAFMHGLLFNNFVSSVHRTYRNSKALLFGFIPNDSENPKLLEESIFNLINFYIEYHNEADRLEYAFNPAQKIFDDFNIVLLGIIEDYSYDPKLLAQKEKLFAAIACYLQIDDITSKYLLLRLLTLCIGIDYDDYPSSTQVILAIIQKGIKKGVEYCYKAYLYAYIFANNSIEMIKPKLLEKMSKVGIAKASFILGNLALSEREDKKALPYWEKAVEQGDYFSLFNLALSCSVAGDSKASIEYANRAIEHGVVFAYIVLYKEYLDTDPELAFTYLRYASEYLIPDARLNLAACQNDETYKPLPFLRHFEQLEDLAYEDAYACMALSHIYNLGIIMPCNEKKALDYQERGISLGYTTAAPVFSHDYKNAFKKDLRNFSLFTTFKESLSGDYGFIINDDEDSIIGDNDRVSSMVLDIVNDLIKGRTKLEHDILHNIMASDLWDDFIEHNLKLPKKLTVKPSYQCYQDLNSLLLTGCYGTTELGISYDSDFLKQRFEANAHLICGLDPKEDNSLAHDVFMYTLSVRSGTQPTQYSEFKYYLQRAANGNFLSAILLNAIDFSSIIDEKEEDFKPKQSSLEPQTKVDSDVFISSVTQ